MLLYLEQDGQPLLNFVGDLKEVFELIEDMVPSIIEDGPRAGEVDIVVDMPNVCVYWIDDFGVTQSTTWEVKQVISQ